MSSFISPFKAWLAAGIVFLAIEATIQLVSPHSVFDRTNFLQFSFVRDETPQRLFVFDKMKTFADSKPTIVQSGDSSGFYGIEPSVVTKYLPASTNYINMSCCANLGFRGYYNVLDFMADRNPSIRYLILHFTPYTMPLPQTWDSDGAALWGIPDIKVFGDAVYDAFISPWRAIFHIPSMAFRRQVTDNVFYIHGLLNQLDRPLLNNVNYLEFLRVFRDTHGWMRESDPRVIIPSTECEAPAPTFFDLRTFSQKTYLQEILESYAAMARRHKTTLVVVFQPVACTLGSGRLNAVARATIDQFKRDNPDVEIPFPLIETWPADMFSVPAHVRWEYTDKLGDRLGTAMKEIMARHGS
jgi:hypothetical protein